MNKTLIFLTVFLFLALLGLFFIPQKSEHFEPRRDPIKYIIVHSFALSVDEMIKRLDDLKVSTHYLIDEEGKLFQLVDDDKVAYHAGKSYWQGQTSLNKTSIGIELQSKTLGQTPFSDKQIQTFKKLVNKLMKKYDIPRENVLGHSDIAPKRKVDPGKMFPWKELNIGPKDIEQGENIENLISIGYDVSNLKAAVLAYRRHFRPESVPTDYDIHHMEENLQNQINDKKGI